MGVPPSWGFDVKVVGSISSPVMAAMQTREGTEECFSVIELLGNKRGKNETLRNPHLSGSFAIGVVKLVFTQPIYGGGGNWSKDNQLGIPRSLRP